MPDHRIDELDDIDVEGPAGTQLTHAPDHGHDMRFDLEREIREHPVRSLAIALVGGFLLAKILD